MTGIIRSLVVTAALAVAACGSSDDNRPPAPPSEGATEAEIHAAIDDYLAWLETCGTLVQCAEIIDADPRWEGWAP